MAHTEIMKNVMNQSVSQSAQQHLSHPKVYSNGGYKVASQKCTIFKAHQDARLPHGRVSQQHHLEQTHQQREGQQVTADQKHD